MIATSNMGIHLGVLELTFRLHLLTLVGVCFKVQKHFPNSFTSLCLNIGYELKAN
jgi:hypothetical protein